MAGKSDYLEGVAIKLALGAAFSYSPPSNVYVGLYSVAPTDAGGGTQLSGGAYARVAVPNNMVSWPIVGTQKTNGAQIDFPIASANWAAIVAVGIFDASTAGNLLFWTNVSPPVSVASGARLSIPVNGLQFTES